VRVGTVGAVFCGGALIAAFTVVVKARAAVVTGGAIFTRTLRTVAVGFATAFEGRAWATVTKATIIATFTAVVETRAAVVTGGPIFTRALRTVTKGFAATFKSRARGARATVTKTTVIATFAAVIEARAAFITGRAIFTRALRTVTVGFAATCKVRTRWARATVTKATIIATFTAVIETRAVFITGRAIFTRALRAVAVGFTAAIRGRARGARATVTKTTVTKTTVIATFAAVIKARAAVVTGRAIFTRALRTISVGCPATIGIRARTAVVAKASLALARTFAADQTIALGAGLVAAAQGSPAA